MNMRMHSSHPIVKPVEDYILALEYANDDLVSAVAEVLHGTTRSLDDGETVLCMHCDEVMPPDGGDEVSCAWLKLDRAMSHALRAQEPK